MLCLDAGASASWSGSGSDWKDMLKNEGDDEKVAGTATPAHNGSPGGLSKDEYFAFCVASKR